MLHSPDLGQGWRERAPVVGRVVAAATWRLLDSRGHLRVAACASGEVHGGGGIGIPPGRVRRVDHHLVVVHWVVAFVVVHMAEDRLWQPSAPLNTIATRWVCTRLLSSSHRPTRSRFAEARCRRTTSTPYSKKRSSIGKVSTGFGAARHACWSSALHAAGTPCFRPSASSCQRALLSHREGDT
jgi:hypothetical protein